MTMRLARINGPAGPHFAIQGADESWVAVDSLGIAADTTPQLVAAADRLNEIEVGRLEGGAINPEFLAPIVAPGEILAIALNYLDHTREQNVEPPKNPILFAKFPNSINDPRGDIVVDPRLTKRADYEVELAVVVGRSTRDAIASEALDSVFGYTVAIDVSARDAQRADRQFSRSKSFDTFCPIGPWITSADAVADPQSLRLWSRVNGETRQDSSTAEMIFSVAYLISYLSTGITLEPGDVLLTGTPNGVGTYMDPRRFLNPGDVVECGIDGLGTLQNRIVAPA
jgi:2-keto-4-pentenoate hydratase/2-oxohepta-3-ene-1,7-dioic acid hydratase in catechol pathway